MISKVSSYYKMRKIKFNALTEEEKGLLLSAYNAAQRSISPMQHKVGAALLANSGEIFCGATLARTRLLGSTCAERMAVDKFYFSLQKQSTPKLLAVIGLFQKPLWTSNEICTPCGVCLEMLFETINDFNIKDLPVICSSWDKEQIVRTSILDLFPKPNPNAARRSWSAQTG